MPTWSNHLPPTEKHMGFDLRRTPQAAPLQAIVTCEELLVCDTHFWGGRTVPCERFIRLPDGALTAGNCPPCIDLMPFRTHVYVSAMDAKSREHFIFECTAHAGKAFEQYHEANGTLRSCIFHAQRPKGKPNSAVVLQTNTANLERVSLPDPPNLIKALSTIWRLPTTGLSASDPAHGKRELAAGGPAIARMREQPDNQPLPERIGDILDFVPTVKANGEVE
jgi:hypothetical protein